MDQPTCVSLLLCYSALFNYDPSTNESQPGRGLSFHFGDVLHVMSATDDGDWWQAQKMLPEDDVIGYIPSKQRSLFIYFLHAG